MTLINSTLMAGMLLASVPVILHLVMRAKPKRIEFPALRLLKTRQTSNARRMQLRHLLLLLLRTLLIATLVLAVARPSLPAARYSLRWWEWLIFAVSVIGAVLVYYWLSEKLFSNAGDSVIRQEKRRRLRLWCVLGGVLAVVAGVVFPWSFRVRAELLSPRTDVMENIPVAAVFILDTSYSMAYRNENRTRLEHARTVVTDHLERLPANSRAAVCGISADDDIIFQADFSGAGSRLDSLTLTSVPESLNRRLKAAIQAQIDDRQRVQEDSNTGGSADLYAREIYVLTDFSRSAWTTPDESELAELIQSHSWLQIYLVDLSVPQPVNAALTGLRLSEETTVAGRDLLLTMNVTGTPGTPVNSTVETLLVDPTGVETRFGAAQIVRLENGMAQIQTAIRVRSDQQFVQGIVRLTTADPLMEDNQRYFCFGVRPMPRILLISDRAEETAMLRHVYMPLEQEKLGTASAECTTVVTAQLGRVNFAQYDVIVVVNCARPEESFWNSLRSFAESGGGVLVVAGSNRIQAESWSVPAARALLPATPIRSVPFRNDPAGFRVSHPEHPAVRNFALDESASAELAAVAVDRRWAVEPAADSRVLMTYTGPDSYPALLERRTGAGQCLMLTSAIDNLNDGGRLWNNFVVSWSFVMFADEMLQHLTGANRTRRNYNAGEAVVFPVPGSQRFEQFLLRRPGLRQTRGSLPAEESSVLLTDAVDPGHYLLRPFESKSTWSEAFAVNVRDSESDLTPISDDDLLGLTGRDRVSIVHDVRDLQRVVRVGRLGVEVFPVIMGLVLMLFCAEHLMSNFFYDSPAETDSSRG